MADFLNLCLPSLRGAVSTRGLEAAAAGLCEGPGGPGSLTSPHSPRGRVLACSVSQGFRPLSRAGLDWRAVVPSRPERRGRSWASWLSPGGVPRVCMAASAVVCPLLGQSGCWAWAGPRPSAWEKPGPLPHSHPGDKWGEQGRAQHTAGRGDRDPGLEQLAPLPGESLTREPQVGEGRGQSWPQSDLNSALALPLAAVGLGQEFNLSGPQFPRARGETWWMRLEGVLAHLMF